MFLQGYDLSRSFLTVSALDLTGIGWHVLACNDPSVHLVYLGLLGSALTSTLSLRYRDPNESTLLFIFTEPYRVRQCNGLQIRSLHESSASWHSLLRL